MVLAICTRARLAVFKITVCGTLTVTAMFMTSTVGKKSVAATLKALDIFLVKLRWNLRSGNLGLSTPVVPGWSWWNAGGVPVDGDGGTDGKVGDNHDTGVEEDEGLGCNLRSRIISIQARARSISPLSWGGWRGASCPSQHWSPTPLPPRCRSSPPRGSPGSEHPSSSDPTGCWHSGEFKIHICVDDQAIPYHCQ